MGSTSEIPKVDPMTEVKDQLYWLQRKGFTEKNLHFPAKQGWLQASIARKYFEALDAIRVYPVIREFSQQITGLFNAEDLVHFNFRYRVDPTTYGLQLASLTARLGENRITILAGTPFDLLPANEIYGRLASGMLPEKAPALTKQEFIKTHV